MLVNNDDANDDDDDYIDNDDDVRTLKNPALEELSPGRLCKLIRQCPSYIKLRLEDLHEDQINWRIIQLKGGALMLLQF